METLRSLRDVIAVNVQYETDAHSVNGVETLVRLTRDSRTVTGRAGPRKPIVRDILDALCTRAEENGARGFAFMNADIHLSQEAVDWLVAGGHDAWLFSREEYNGATGAALGMNTAGVDVVAFSTLWWRHNRFRFRPYLVGEAVWDNVFTAIVMCHANAVLENRRPLVRHEAHPIVWSPDGPFGRYTQYLAALDSGYFSIWCRYWAGLQDLRRVGAAEAQERALATKTFVWAPSLAERATQVLRAVKANLRYRLRR